MTTHIDRATDGPGNVWKHTDLTPMSRQRGAHKASSVWLTGLPAWSAWILPVTVSVFLFALNTKVPLFADDYCRKGGAFDPLHAAWAAYRDYLRWTGRLPVMFLNRLFFSADWLGVMVLNIINSAFVLLLARLVMLHTRTEDSPWRFTTVFAVFLFLTWFGTDVLGEVALWKTGQVQYFWAAVIALACITPAFQFVIWRKDVEWSRVTSAIYLLACVIGGMWLEHQSVAVCMIWGVLLAYARFVERREVPAMLWLGLLGWVLGTAILVAAPGNYARAEVLGEQLGLFEKVLPVSWRFLSQIDKKLLAVYAIFATYQALVSSSGTGRQFAQSLVFLWLAYLCALTTVGAPNIVYAGRIAFPSEFFLVCSVISLFPVMTPGEAPAAQGSVSPLLRQAPLALAGVLCMFVLLVDARSVYHAYDSIRLQEMRRQELIEQARLGAVRLVELPPLYFDRGTHTGKGPVNQGRRLARDITTDPGRWENVCFAKAHGVRQVRLK